MWKYMEWAGVSFFTILMLAGLGSMFGDRINGGNSPLFILLGIAMAVSGFAQFLKVVDWLLRWMEK